MKISRTIYVLTFLAITAATLPGCNQNKTDEPGEAPPVAVRVIAARAGDMRSSVRYIGNVHSHREVRIVSRLSGIIDTLPAAEGTTVEAGALLADISAPEMDAKIRRVEAELSRAKVESRFACEKYQTDLELMHADALSDLQLKASHKACSASESAVAAASASLTELKQTASYRMERAPFNGKVLKTLVSVGETVMPGKPLLTFGDDLLEVRVQVVESDLNGGIRKGSPVILHFADGTKERSSVASLSSLATTMGRVTEARIPVTASTGRLHGTSVEAKFIVAETLDAIAVPDQAIRRQGGGNSIFVIRDNHAVAVAVSPGVAEGGWRAVEGALQAGTKVVAKVPDDLTDGSKIYAVEVDKL